MKIGAGSGLLEGILLHNSQGSLHLYAVEVPSCSVKYLDSSRVIRVPSTSSVHVDTTFTEVTLLFVYPRRVALVAEYCSTYGVTGVVRQAILLTHAEDAKHAEEAFSAIFSVVKHIKDSGLPEYETLVVASCPILHK